MFLFLKTNYCLGLDERATKIDAEKNLEGISRSELQIVKQTFQQSFYKTCRL